MTEGIMLGIIYLILAMLLGYEASAFLIEKEEQKISVNRNCLKLPAALGTGILLLTCSGRCSKSTAIWKCDRACQWDSNTGSDSDNQKEKKSSLSGRKIMGR